MLVLKLIFTRTSIASRGSLRQQRVRPSVRHEPVLCQNEETSVMISSLSGSTMILVFWCQMSSRHSKGFHPSGGLKEGWGGKM